MESAAGHRTILLAEDNAIVRDMLMHQLRLLGREAVAVEDGIAALDAWRGGAFSLLLTDVQMPRLDGYGLAVAVRGEETHGAIPIVVLTASDSAVETDRCAAAGVDDVLTKPASLATLRRVLDKWLGPTPPPTAPPSAKECA